MSSDNTEVILKDYANMLQSCAELIHKYGGEEKHSQLGSLKNMAVNAYNCQHEHENNVIALNSIYQHFEDDIDNISDDVDKVYRKCLDQVCREIIPFEEHPMWKPVHKVLDEREEGSSDSSASFVVSQCSSVPIDPLTK